MMMKILTHKDILLLSLIILSQLHVLCRGSEVRVDWYLCIEHTRRLDYAVMYACRYIIQLILAYCVMFPNNINKNVKLFIFTLCAIDLIHYITFSSIGYEQLKILLSFVIYKIIKPYVKTC